ncbi:MAG: insulinase family protein [Anaerolineae bacterium]|nr:insulinase family protein [Anaerolineae bacterium]
MTTSERAERTGRDVALPGPHDIVRETLPNGITVLVRENFSNQSVVISGSLAVGSVFEDATQAGLSAFTASALMRGTQRRDFDTLHEALEGIGASLGIGGDMHSTGFGGKALGEDLFVLLDILSDALREPAFPTDQTERLRGEILTGLRIRAQDTRAVAGEAFRKLAYPPDHPYSRSVSGEIATISALTLDDLRAFHARHYGPKGMILVIVGAVKAAEALDLVRLIFGGWQNPDQPEPPELPEAPRLGEAAKKVEFVPGKTQSDIVIGWPGPSRFDPDFQAANLLNNVLGVFGMMGRLGKNVREDQGLAYYSYSRLRGGEGPGPWSVAAGVNPANVGRAVESILKEIEVITSAPVSDEDLADNKANFTGRLPLTVESNEGVAASILNMETYHLGLDYLLRYTDMINSITRDDLMAAARRYLSPTGYALAVAGPALE